MGYTYVMSDIHGDFSSFETMLDTISFSQEDTLYLLGDIVDRGKENLPMLDFVRNEKNIILIKGNHEYFMQTYLTKDKNFSKIWRLDSFGGGNTLEELKPCDQLQRNQYGEYLESLPLYITLDLNDQFYLLTHSGWLATKDPYWYHLNGMVDTVKNLSRMIIREREYLVSTDIHSIPKEMVFDRRFVVGHVPTTSHIFPHKVRGKIFHSSNYYDIDCGNCMGNKGGRLGCLRLDDLLEFYI